jgi:hypothetical protein
MAANLALARREGWIDGTASLLRLTDDGAEALGPFATLPTGPRLLAYWIAAVGATTSPGRVLRELANVYPEAISQEQLGANTGISPRSGGMAATLAKLRKLELITGTAAGLRMSEELA